MTVLARLNQYGTLLGREFDETTANNISISGLGTFFASEFVENVGITTTLVTKTFLTYDPVADDFIGDPLSDALGGSKGTYMRYNTDKSVVVYEDIDEVNDYRDIVKDGLVLDLDASSSLSYPGSGTTWNDLSGLGNNGTLVNGVGYNSGNGGSLVFDGVDDSVNFDYDLRTSWSYECWVLHNVVSGFAFLGQGTTTTSNGLHIWFRDASNLRFGMYSNDADALSLTTSTGIWYHYCFTYNHNTFLKEIYRNGVQLTVTPQYTQIQYTGTGTVRIGAIYSSGGNYANGRIASSKLYTRILTPQEIQQNYNALKSFYGL